MSATPRSSPSSIEMAGDKYKILGQIGQGAQGIVLKAEPTDKPGEYVAVKKLKNLSDSNGIAMDTIREIYMLRELNHPNVVSILDIFGRGGHLYIIMPFAVGDLDELIRDRSVLLKSGDIKGYMIQLLHGVQYLHDKFILHRDLKPQNCLILASNVLKISDFGLSREYGSPNRPLSHQACTIWYRSPELLFGANYYATSLDMWSAGCIFAELLLRVAIFGGNDNTEIAQIGRIFKILGTPINEASNEEEKQSNLYWKDHQILPKFRKFVENEPYPIDQIFKAQSKNAKHLFLSLCRYDPNKRLSAKQALQHEYFKEEPQPTPTNLLPNPKKNKHANANVAQQKVPSQTNLKWKWTDVQCHKLTTHSCN